jgi:hypothetical protein
MPDSILMETDMTGSLFLRDQFSIIGRSVVIHDAVDGSNFECGTIRSVAEQNGKTAVIYFSPCIYLYVLLHPPGAEVTLLQSSFVNPVGGTIYFRQVEGEDVQIWGKVYYTDDTPTTFDHNWHIHILAVRHS